MMISILTPTYNREDILPKLYESLKNQSEKNFEWIVVDDGSIDRTEELVNKWRDAETEFDIVYIKQDNGGKHRAINRGITIVKYDYTYIVDSDDYLVDSAITLINKWIKQIDNNKKYAGVSGCKGKHNGNELERIGSFPKGSNFIDSNNIDRIKNNLQGDKSEIYRTDILRKYPFPEFQDEKFLWESVVWNKIASDGFLIRWFPEITCICEYLPNGLTNTNGEMRNISNFRGYTMLENLNFKTLPFPYNLFSVGRYNSIAKKNKKSTKEIKNNLEINGITFFIGVVFNYLKERYKIIINK